MKSKKQFFEKVMNSLGGGYFSRVADCPDRDDCIF